MTQRLRTICLEQCCVYHSSNSIMWASWYVQNPKNGKCILEWSHFFLLLAVTKYKVLSPCPHEKSSYFEVLSTSEKSKHSSGHHKLTLLPWGGHMSDRQGSVGEDQRPPPAFLFAIATGCVQLSQHKTNKQKHTWLCGSKSSWLWSYPLYLPIVINGSGETHSSTWV